MYSAYKKNEVEQIQQSTEVKKKLEKNNSKAQPKKLCVQLIINRLPEKPQIISKFIHITVQIIDNSFNYKTILGCEQESEIYGTYLQGSHQIPDQNKEKEQQMIFRGLNRSYGCRTWSISIIDMMSRTKDKEERIQKQP